MTDGGFRVELAELLEALHTPVALSGPNHRVAYQNAAHRRLFGEARGQACHAVFRGEAGRCADCPQRLECDPVTSAPERGGSACRGRCYPLDRGWCGHEVVPESSVSEGMSGFLGRCFESSGAAVFLEDPDGTILAMNRAAERLYGYDRGEWLGRSVLDLIPEEVRPRFPEVQRQLEQQGAFSIAAGQCRADGGLFQAQVEGFRLDGPEPLVLVTVREVTAAVGERESLETQSQEFEHFLHSVAHDLRTPLVGIKGYANLIDRALTTGDQGLRGHVQTMLRQTERMESLLEDLLEYSRIGQTGELAMDLDVATSARAAWQDLGAAVQTTGATLVLDEPLPAVRMAPVRLTQLLVNLFSNAVKYGREGIPPRVELGAVEEAPVRRSEVGSVCLRVRDNGVGVEPGEREAIFELFRQGGRLHREGAGLGLALVRRIVESCGGKVWVGPKKGPGTDFYLVLPGAEKQP